LAYFGIRIRHSSRARARDIYKRLSSVQQEVLTHRHDRHQTSVSKAVARVVEVRWLMKKLVIVAGLGLGIR
jgi:hypothetical protein